PFLRMFGYVLLAIEAADQAVVAKRISEERGETPELRAKLLGLDFYVKTILPQAIALAKSIQSSDATCLDESL
ncbi:MAG: acyl-CoA dehydrogenase C-terminal domain-containing protein, partial [Nannocystaceae bacterium]